MTGWWFNELGEPHHLACGAAAAYITRAGRHWMHCHGCDKHQPAPTPGVRPVWPHPTYGRTN